MRKTLNCILAVLIMTGITLSYAFTAFAGDDSTVSGEAQNACVKVYSQDSSHGKVMNGGSLIVEPNAYITTMGNRLIIEGVEKDVFAVPGDGYVFDGWSNVPTDNLVEEGAVILATFRPVGLDTTSRVTAGIAPEAKNKGSIAPVSSIRVLTNSEIQVHGSTVLVAKESFSAIPKAGEVFSRWEGVPRDGIIHGDTTITAIFETPENAVTISFQKPAIGGSFISTTGGMDITMPAGAEIKVDGTQLTLGGREYVMAIPYYGYEFSGWSGIPKSGRADADITISAAFSPAIPEEITKINTYSFEDGESFQTDLIYGDMDAPVTDGLWVRDNDSSWRYEWHVPMANAWGCLDNPYAHEDQPGHGWFFFDRKGKMLTGWRVINNKWYYFEPISNGCKGQLYTDTDVPDDQSAIGNN